MQPKQELRAEKAKENTIKGRRKRMNTPLSRTPFG